MAFSASFHASLYAISSPHNSKLFIKLKWLQKRVALVTARGQKNHSLWIINSALNNRQSSVDDNEATEPARILLERLFAQTQKLEEKIGKDLNLPQDVELELNLGKLESALQAALAALKKKEEDLVAAERKILMEYNDLNQAKEELHRREEVALAASVKQKKLEEELKEANLKLASQVVNIEELKLQLDQKDRHISAAQSALSLKEDEMNKMINELMTKTEEAANAETELLSTSQLLDDTNEIVKRQALEIQELRKAIQEKEQELEVSLTLRRAEEEKLKVVEANLEQQTMDWLLAQQEMKKLEEEASKHTLEANETLENFTRMKKLLSDVRSELVSSQKALALSRQKMEDQQLILENQLVELEEQRTSVTSYMTSLKDAQLEVESERFKLRVAEARNKELERDLAVERDLIKELQKQLDQEKCSLQQAAEEMCILQKELERRKTEYEKSQKLLEVKESELVEARLEIQHLKSEKASLQLILEEKDLELSNARNMLIEVNQEIAELRVILNSREDQLAEVTSMLKEKEEQVDMMHHDLYDAKQKFSEAESVVEQIVELTNKVVISIKDEDYTSRTPSEEKPVDNFKWQKKQLETELKITRETLRSREMEVLAAQRSLTIKDKELNMVLGKLEEREKELKEMKEELARDENDLRKLYALAQERIGEKSIGDLAIEKLQLEAAQLEVEAATTALQKITEMSREFLDKASLSAEADYDVDISPDNDSGTAASIVNDDGFLTVKAEVARLSDFTEKLVKEAGIVGDIFTEPDSSLVSI